MPQTSVESTPSIGQTSSVSSASESVEQPQTIRPEPTANPLTASLLDAGTPVVYFNQKDEAWKNELYGEDSIGGYGCGPTACSIILSTLTGQIITPKEMADWSVQNGCYIPNGGSYHTLLPLACRAFGLCVTGYGVEEKEAILSALQDGALVGVIMGEGHFTRTGHFIVLHGVDEQGRILVADPASYDNSEIAWDADIIFSEAKAYAGGGGPFWSAVPAPA